MLFEVPRGIVGLALLIVAGSSVASCTAKSEIPRTVSLPAVLPDHPLNGFDIGLDDREVILTFDDGPNTWSTPGVLSALDAAGVKATFFMLGEQAKKNGPMARKILASGHNVGSHTFSHIQLSTLNDRDANLELERGVNGVNAALPEAYRSRLFRFPFLDRSDRLLRMSNAAGLTAIDVDVTGDDYTGSSCLISVAKMLWRLERLGRGIVLIHDSKLAAPCETRTLLFALKLLNFRVVQLNRPV